MSDNKLTGALLLLRAMLDGDSVNPQALRVAVKILTARQVGSVQKEAHRQARILR